MLQYKFNLEKKLTTATSAMAPASMAASMVAVPSMTATVTVAVYHKGSIDLVIHFFAALFITGKVWIRGKESQIR